jgi:hypothetical protein
MAARAEAVLRIHASPSRLISAGAQLFGKCPPELAALLIAAVIFALLRDRFALRPAIRGQRAANVNLLFRKRPIRSTANIPLVTFVRLDQLA